MKKVYFFVLSLILLTGYTAKSQCTNTSAFGTVTAPTGSTPVTISSCSFQSEYSTINSVIGGNRYVVTASIPGTFITIRYNTSSGTVVAMGETPLQFTAPCNGTYFAHWNTNSSCGTASSCMITTIACSSCGAAASQCTNPSAFGIVTAPTTINVSTTISSCSFQNEYSTINSAVANRVYRITGSIAGTFITIRQGTSSGPVIASGVTPIAFTAPVAGTYFAHWNTNSTCGLASSCMTTTITYIADATCIGAVANDLCTGAININCGQTINGTTVGATLDAVGTCVTTLNTAPGVWYSFTGDGSIVTLSLCGSAYDTKIGVFSGTCAGLVCVTGNDDFCGLQSQVTFNSVPGTNYFVLVTGFSTASGAFSLARTCIAPCSGVPSPGVISGPGATLCRNVPVTLNLSGYTNAPGITFQWRSSTTPGGPYTNIPGATSPSYTFNTTTTQYFIVNVTCTFSGLSSNTTEFAVNVDGISHTNVSATPSTTCTPGSTVITGTAVNGILGAGSGVIGTSGTINLAIPDNSPAGVNSTIVLPATNIPNAGSLQIRINARHSWVGDVVFRLTSPCGVTFLFDRPGVPASTFGNSDNLGTSSATTPPPAVYTFDVAAATVIPETTGGAGFIAAGNYRPSDAGGAAHNWAGFTFPCTAAGNWVLNVSDNAGGDVGTLVDWQILGPIANNYTHTLTGPGTIVQNASTGPNNQTANFSVSNLPAGSHSFTLTSTDPFGCSISSNVPVTVNPTPVITFTPPAPVTCAGTPVQVTAGAAPPSTQTFSSGTINLAIPDNNPVGVNSTIVLPAATNITAASNLRVRINARHSWVGDVIFRLTSPCGTTFLFDRPGVPASTFGNSDNLGTSSAATPPPAVYTFDLSAATVLPETTGGTGFIAAGNYRPSDAGGAAHNWAGVTFPCNATGNWVLNISDNAGGDTGALIDWAVLVDTPSPVVFTPATNLFTNSAGTIPYVAGTPVNTVWANPPTTTVYTATATINGCTNSANVTVTVNQLPAITTQPAALAAPVCPGFNVTYSVGATGAGLTYQWQLSTDNGATWNNISNGVQYSGTTTASLTVLNVQTTQNGHRFRVIVSGTCPPPVTSNAVILTVSTPPTITTQPANRIVCAPDAATFSVVAAGVPAPNIYQWQVSTDAGATWTNLTTGGSYTPTLTVSPTATSQNNNRYRVIVTNSCGQSITSSAAILTVNARTPITIAPLPTRICLSDTLVPLTATPVGGSWSGIGISGFNFVPPVTAVGSYTLTYTYTNAANCTSTGTVIANVQDCPERIRQLDENAVILYPNPNDGHFNIRINSVLYNYLGMTVYNTMGQRVLTQNFNGLVYGRVVPINISSLPSGTYMIKFFYDDGIRTNEKTFPVVIQR